MTRKKLNGKRKFKSKWRQYITYRELKTKIKYYKSIFLGNNIIEREIDLNEGNNQIMITPEVSLDVHCEKLENLFLKTDGNHLKIFLELIDTEIKKIYTFYTQLERELYISLNLELQKRNNIMYVILIN